MATPILRTEGLTKDYGSYRALNDLTLSVQPGEIVGLLGPNGSGKSTALRILLGFMRPSSGSASIGGFDCWTQGVKARRSVTYLPGELRLYERMNGRELIRFLGRLRGESPGPEIEALATRLDIDIDRPLIHMSSGMKRKVALLSVLVPNVPLIILDEPTNTLDPTMRDQLLTLLREARDRGQAVLFSSHVLAEVEEICDRVAILRRGCLVHMQPIRELKLGRHVRAVLEVIPTTGPDDQPLPDGSLDGPVLSLNHHGDVTSLLAWLQHHRPSEVRIEPFGLGPIYRRFHDVVS